MRKIWMLAHTQIRKNKGQTLSLLTLLVIAGMLLYLGLFLTLNTNGFFDDKMKKLNTPDIVITLQDTIFGEDDIAYYRDNPKVQAVETIETVVFPNAQAEYAGRSINASIVFFDEKKIGGMFSPRFVGERLPPTSDSVYLPYLYHMGGGFELGDAFTLTYGAEDYTFTIVGFFEDVHLGLISINYTGIILPDFGGFVRKLENPVFCNTILVRVYEKEYAQLIKDHRADKELNTDPELFNKSYMSGTWYQNTKTAITLTMKIASGIIVLFSMLIVIVALIVVHFRITNSIEDDMVNIGSLKAAGYTSRQVIGNILTQFMLIAIVGSGLGIICSLAVKPLLSVAFASQNGLVWDGSFDIISALLTLVLISGTVLLTSLWASRRIRMLHPIIALRGGITTHSFKKNRFPLDETNGGLGFLLALKTIKLKQSISVALICAAVTFASAVFIILYYNVGVNDKAFVNLVVAEYTDVSLILAPETDPWELLEEARELEDVCKATFYSYLSGQVDRHITQIYITEDFSELEGGYIYEGRSPKHNNEIAIGGGMASELGLKIGNTITFSFQGGTAEYLICGLGQSADNNGWTAQITLDGAYRMNPQYRPSCINIYAKEGTDLDNFYETTKTVFGTRTDSIVSFDKSKASLDTYINLIFIITIMILCVTGLVITLVLHMSVKTLILRSRRALGIQKAVGFTTGQLVRQIALSFMLPVMVGVCLGCILGGVFVNPLFSLLFRSIGFMRTDFVVMPMLIVVTGAVIGSFAYVVALLASWRIRKISAYGLMIACKQ